METPVHDASIEFEVDNLSSRQVLLEKYKGKSGVAVVYKVKAYNELMQLKKELHPRQPWIIHGFRGKEGVALDLLRHDCYLSFGARFQEEAVRAVPLERLFIETDDAPESIGDVCRSIAQVRGVSPEELAEAVNKNVREVFFKH